VLTALKQWRALCPKSKLDLVFPNGKGEHIQAQNLLNRHFLPALERAGLRRIRWHELRHTFASLLVKQKEHIKYAQTQLGHHAIGITLDVYSHLMESINPEASIRLDKTVFGEEEERQTEEVTPVE